MAGRDNVHLRKDGRYEARYAKGRDAQGKIIYGFCYAGTYEEAKEKEENPGEWLSDLIEVMAYQELLRRRCEHRNIRKKLYY